MSLAASNPDTSITVKVCGLTRAEDVECARSLGADYFGFIGYKPSPRSQELSLLGDLARLVPEDRRVFVDVEPSTETIKTAQSLGFKQFQLHFTLDAGEALLPEWSKWIAPEDLWLAPRLPESASFPDSILKYARTVLIDSYSEQSAGGTGVTGDWQGFLALQEKFETTRFVLAGGLNSGNICEAVGASGASFVDVNSGVESAPGLKDPKRMAAFFDALHSRS